MGIVFKTKIVRIKIIKNIALQSTVLLYSYGNMRMLTQKQFIKFALAAFHPFFLKFSAVIRLDPFKFNGKSSALNIVTGPIDIRMMVRHDL